MTEALTGALPLILIFLAKAVIVLIVIVAIIVLIAVLAQKNKMGANHFEIELLHEKFEDYQELLKAQILTKEELKAEKKKKKNEKSKNEDLNLKKRVFVVDFKGDIKAEQTEELREEVTVILSVANPDDEVVVRLESPGGAVTGYGLAASQLSRIREKNIPLTVCIDEVAASGGYLMSCVANRIIASPFAIVGSIGVVSQVPNFHRLLKKYDVDYKEYTAGDFKRTISIFGEITEKGEKKFIEQLEDIHYLFKSFVHKYRPQLDINSVATGEYWFGPRALELNLVDEIRNSDDYLLSFIGNAQIVKVKYEKKMSLQDRIAGRFGAALEKAFIKILTSLEKLKYE